MRRTLLATGFVLFAAALALCAALYAEHRSAVVEFFADGPASERLARPVADGEVAPGRPPAPLVELRVAAGETVRVAATWGLRPDLDCDRNRLRAEQRLVPGVLDGLRVVWRAESNGVRQVAVEQPLAGAPVDGPAGWSRVPEPFHWTAGPAATLGADLEAVAGARGLASPACWTVSVVGQRSMPLRGRDVAALLAVPAALALLLLGMWRRPATATAEVVPPPRWRWLDAALPVGLTAGFLVGGSFVPWWSADAGSRLLEQVPCSAALGLGVALAVARLRSRSPLASLGGRPAGRPNWIAAGLAAGVLLALPAAWLLGARLPTDPASAVLWVPGSVLAFAAAASAAALSEEVFWRGLVFEVVASRLGACWAVVATAVPFTAAHWVSREEHPWALGVVAVLAAALGLLRARTGSLVPGVALHAGYNLALVLLGYVAAA